MVPLYLEYVHKETLNLIATKNIQRTAGALKSKSVIGWHVLIHVIHSRHPTWLATDQVPSLAGFLVSSGGDSFVAYHLGLGVYSSG